MDYTNNCHLPQWVKSDRIMMDDFNAAMNNIDANIADAKSAAARAQSPANSAKSAASSAQSAASSAQSTANQALSGRPYVTGTYTGTGEAMTIQLGFKPKFLIVTGNREASDQAGIKYFNLYGCATAGNLLFHTIELTSTGFKVMPYHSYCPILTESKRIYDYIAFK